jgi:hypothetical protein
MRAVHETTTLTVGLIHQQWPVVTRAVETTRGLRERCNNIVKSIGRKNNNINKNKIKINQFYSADDFMRTAML